MLPTPSESSLLASYYLFGFVSGTGFWQCELGSGRGFGCGCGFDRLQGLWLWIWLQHGRRPGVRAASAFCAGFEQAFRMDVEVGFVFHFAALVSVFGPVRLEEFGGICERKTLFRMKKEADQAEFKDTRTGPLLMFV